MMRFLFKFVVIVVFALLLSGSRVLRAQSLPERYPLTSVAVAAALETSGLSINPVQIEIPPSLSAASGNPDLRIADAEGLSQSRLRVRVTCYRGGECQPFFAVVTMGSTPELKEALVQLKQKESANDHSRNAQASGHLQAGKRATLLMQDTRMRIEIPVIAIDSGAPGAEIRVNTMDRKTTFRAVVLDAETVEGALP